MANGEMVCCDEAEFKFCTVFYSRLSFGRAKEVSAEFPQVLTHVVCGMPGVCDDTECLFDCE